jgi:hypothetical protein
MLKVGMWDQLQVNFFQAPEGFVAIHAYKKGNGCTYFEIPYKWINEPDFFERVYKMSLEKWKTRMPKISEKCSVCAHPFMAFHFRYKGKYFCRYCGTHYDIDGTKIIVTRRLSDKT